MKARVLREKADIELREELAQLRKELFQRRFRGGSEETEERGKFGKLRREVARILTLLKEREQGIRGQKPSAGSGEAK